MLNFISILLAVIPLPIFISAFYVDIKYANYLLTLSVISFISAVIIEIFFKTPSPRTVISNSNTLLPQKKDNHQKNHNLTSDSTFDEREGAIIQASTDDNDLAVNAKNSVLNAVTSDKKSKSDFSSDFSSHIDLTWDREYRL